MLLQRGLSVFKIMQFSVSLPEYGYRGCCGSLITSQRLKCNLPHSSEHFKNTITKIGLGVAIWQRLRGGCVKPNFIRTLPISLTRLTDKYIYTVYRVILTIDYYFVLLEVKGSHQRTRSPRLGDSANEPTLFCFVGKCALSLL